MSKEYTFQMIYSINANNENEAKLEMVKELLASIDRGIPLGEYELFNIVSEVEGDW